MSHSVMIEKGIHAITIKTFNEPKLKYNNERDRLFKLLGNMEHLFRITDQLDE